MNMALGASDLRGQIILVLTESADTTEGIASSLCLDRSDVIFDLIRLYHRGVIAPIAIQTNSRDQRRGFDRNLVWQMTDHGRFHVENEPGCPACDYRARLILQMMPEGWSETQPRGF